MKIRSIYKGDVRFDDCPVFEFEKASNDFVMLRDKECRYSLEAVMCDSDFMIFIIEDGRAISMSKRKFRQSMKYLITCVTD